MILDVERVARGGSCVARAPDGRVVFVRHALPGERVRAVVTDERSSFLRADAVEVLRAAPARVPPACPWSGPGRCGGCDWQHVVLSEQRRLKAAVVAEQLRRLAGLDRDVDVEPVDDDGLGWRTRVRFAVDGRGRAGLRRHRSHEVEPVGDCLIAHPDVRAPDVLARHWTGESVDVEVDGAGGRVVVVTPPGPDPEASLTRVACGRTWTMPVGGFWQVHPRAADVLRSAVRSMAGLQRGERCLDLYAGVGLFAGVLADAVGPERVVAVEAEPRAAAAASRNLPGVEVVTARVERWLARQAVDVDVVVLDPPRRGAGRAVVDGVAALGPRSVVYVACDPAALARDVATFAGHGYRMAALRAFDLFPMTAHVECVARLDRV